MRRWHSVAQNYLVLNAILAAVSGIIVQKLTGLWLCVGLVALVLFVFDAEKTADAVAHDKPSWMVRHHNIYNFAVLLLLLCLAAWLAHWAHWRAYYSVPAFVVASGWWLYGWGCDFHYLLRKENRRSWVRQLRAESAREPTSPSPPPAANIHSATTTLAVAIAAVALLCLARPPR
jgi:hypothetical protein